VTEIRTFVFPTAHAQIHDNWYVMGLSGTGSCDYSVSDLFVPEEFTYEKAAPPRRGGPIYRLGLPGFITVENAAFALGVARRALDEIIALARSKVRGYTKRTPLVGRPVFQRTVGESDLKLRAARALKIAVLEKAWATVCEGHELDLLLQTELRSAGALVADVALEVATAAFRYGGGTGIGLNHPLQRCLRDLQTAGTHFLVSDSSYENYGMALLGLPDADPLG
jgi:alkylation response protein AidB-like acyl-CoA dehydrogenase